MKIKLLKHGVVVQVLELNEKTKIAKVKLYGTICKFNKHEYEEVVDV